MPKDVRGVLHEYKHGKLHSGSKHGPVVKSRKQAIAIAMSEQREMDKGKTAVHRMLEKRDKGRNK